MTALVVQECGPMTTIQDAGRFGWQRFGVSNAGAMDRLALAAANALVGNGPGAAAIEFTLLGGVFTIEGGPARVAVAGAPCAVALDGQPVPAMTSALAHDGQRLTIGPAQAGVFAYLAVAGGLDLLPQLGSLSLQPRAWIGGFQGRPLRPGDRVPLLLAEPPPGLDLALELLPLDADAPVRVVFGPQDDLFTPNGIETFLTAAYAVSREADRMGYRLTGPPVQHLKGYNIVSDGVVAGSVQVPGGGEPIVMMADRQTTGGYPKIATVISADLRVLAQRRPGQRVRFAGINICEAQRLARERAQLIAAFPARCRPARGGALPPIEELLALNLAGAAVDALSET
jgi:biotin-dependent carboxylase-like uncharacterized protein